MNKYIIHYFSGTGNTYHMVKVMERELINCGHTVELLNIEKVKNFEIDNYNIHLFCYPIYGFGTPSIMLNHADKLKGKEGCKAAIVCTSAGFEGQSLSHLKQLLNKRGFEVFYSDMVLYTYNWTQLFNPQSKEIEEKVFKEADEKVIKLINRVVNNDIWYKRVNGIAVALSWGIFLLFRNLGRKILGKTYIADESCVSCGKCSAVCPAKAISMYNEKPRWNWKCELCQRCINLCPSKSIQLSVVKLFIFILMELIPIVAISYMNKNIRDLPILIDIILYLIMFSINTILANIIILLMEKVKWLRKILQISYTKKYRRNVAKGFDIKL